MGKTGSSVDRVYKEVRRMASNFEFKPDERINESALSSELGASRTPLREALNRLVAEGFLTFQNGRGFFCRSLSPGRILDLYEARQAIECEALHRSVERASDEDLREVADYLDETEPHYGNPDMAIEVLDMDERSTSGWRNFRRMPNWCACCATSMIVSDTCGWSTSDC